MMDNMKRIVLAAVVTLIYALTINLNAFLLPVYGTEILGLSDSQIGLLVGAPGVLALVFLLPAAALSNYFGRKPMLILTAISNLIAATFFLTAKSFAGLAAAQLVMGIANATMWPALAAHYSSLVGPERQAEIQATNCVAQGLGLVIGPIISGFVIKAAGYPAAIGTWMGAAGIQLLLTAMVRDVPGTREGMLLQTAFVEPLRKLKPILGQRPLIVAGAAQLTSAAIISAIGGAFFIRFAQEAGFAAALVSVMISTREVSSTASRMVYAYLARIIPNSVLLSLSPLIAGGALLLGFLWPHPVVLFAVVILVGLALGVVAPASNTLAIEMAAPEDMTETIAAVTIMFQVGTILFPPFIGSVVDHTSLATGVRFGAGLILAAGLFLLAWSLKDAQSLSTASHREAKVS
ncbi:MAG: MFS transporter [Firmicutes bacterium]|nr:MFS transporter [Bacillota bacterium]